jgi:arabinofuranosyltransferase
MGGTLAKLTSAPMQRVARVVLWLAPVVVFSAGGFARRWMDDDGFINLRIVRNLLRGHGLVFNLGDRVEAGTSPLWIGFMALLGATHVPLEAAAVYAGIALSTSGLVLAMRGADRLQSRKGGGTDEVAWPVGAAIYAVIPAAWDYASSGLDTGLGLFWFGASYAFLANVVREGPDAADATGSRKTYAAAALFGLGPLIRPELALYSIVLLVPLVWRVTKGPSESTRAGRWALVGIAASAGALPVAYELFRMGYYGAITPNTAIAKEAFRASLTQGVCYFHNFFWVYAMGFPASGAAVFYLVRLRALRLQKYTLGLLIAVLLPLAGAVHIAYVVVIGGDYMHARMFLPPVFAMALPIFVVRIGTLPDRLMYGLLASGGVISCWMIICATRLHCPTENECYIGDERGWYAQQASVHAPMALATYRGHPFFEDGQKALAAIEKSCPDIDSPDQPHEGPCHLLYFDEKEFEALGPSQPTFPLASDLDPRIGAAVAYGAIGIFGYMMPDTVHVIDRHGLAEPVASHLELPIRGRPGHEKTFLSPWLVARYAAPLDLEDTTVTAARHALRCGTLRKLVEAGTAPLTRAQFLSNMAHAFGYTRFRIPLDPFEAESLFCGTPDLPHEATGTDGGLPYRWQCPVGWSVSSLRFAFAGGSVERFAANCDPDQGGGPGRPTVRGPLFGGNLDQPAPIEVRCPRGNTAVGIYGTRGSVVEGLGLQCSASGGAPAHGPAKGRMSATPFELKCPAGTRLIGIEGRAGDLVDHVGIVCAPP